MCGKFPGTMPKTTMSGHDALFHGHVSGQKLSAGAQFKIGCWSGIFNCHAEPL
jgi:hypothetical protein